MSGLKYGLLAGAALSLCVTAASASDAKKYSPAIVDMDISNMLVKGPVGGQAYQASHFSGGTNAGDGFGYLGNGPLEPSHVKSLLESRGYHDFGRFYLLSGVYSVTARNAKDVAHQLQVDAGSGEVLSAEQVAVEE